MGRSAGSGGECGGMAGIGIENWRREAGRARRVVADGALLAVAPLAPEDQGRAVVLARFAAPQLDLERWLHCCGERAGDGAAGGLLAARSARGVVYGLCAFRVVENPQDGRCLQVEWLLALHPLQPEAVIRALLQAVRRTAGARGCAAIRIGLQEPGSELCDLLQQAGYRPAGQWLQLALPDAGAAILPLAGFRGRV